MKIIAVDNNEICLKKIKRCIEDNYRNCEVIGFKNSREALEYGRTHKISAIYTEVNLSGINGFSLVQKLREYNNEIDITFVTDTEEYAVDAFQIHADGYIIKPISTEAIQKKLLYKR